MKKLYENTALGDISSLDDAWDSKETFLFLPDRTDVSTEWIDTATEQFPDFLKTDHFALLTSGSTGLPKIVVGSKERSEKLTEVLHLLQDSEPIKQTVLSLPQSYCYAFVNQWLWSKKFNKELVITPGFKQAGLLKAALDKAEDAMLCLVGAQIPFFEQRFVNSSFPGIIRLHFAGGPFPQNKIGTVRRLFPNAQIFNNYGCAEAMPRLTIRRLEESDKGANIGKPLPGIIMKSGADGEILFTSPYGAVAFYDENGIRLVGENEFIPSGDLGNEIEGGYWWIAGRSNQVFKRYGEKIALPRLLETVNLSWSGESAFYREKDPSGEEGHVLLLSPSPNPEQLREILQGFRKNHPRAHWPLRIESIEKLPLLPNGKIDLAGLEGSTNRTTHWRQRI